MTRNLFFISIFLLGIIGCCWAEGISDIGFDVAKSSQAVVLIKDNNDNSLGAGFFVSSDGLIVTNYTVIKDTTDFIIQLSTKEKKPASVLRINKKANSAIIKIAGSDFPFLELEDSGNVKIVDRVVALGYPFDGKENAFAGRVQSIDKAQNLGWLKFPEKENANPFDYFIMIRSDVEEPQLFNGSPLFNIKGKVIGVNTLVHSYNRKYLYSIASGELLRAFPEEFRQEDDLKGEIKKGKFECKTNSIRYAMYVPSYYSKTKQWPLILAFHPAGDGKEIRDFWADDAEKNGFIIAAGCTFQGDIWYTSDDYKIFRMLKHILTHYSIDKKRIYLTGLSGGAIFTYYLGINYPQYFTAMAPVSGSMFNVQDELRYSRKTSEHIPVLIVQGVNDDVVCVSTARNAAEKLRSYGYKVLVYEVKEMGHEHRPFKDQIYKKIVEFFNK